MMIQSTSSLSMANTLRMTIRATQAALVTAQQELTTGVKADPARELGLRNGFRMSLLRESERLDSIVATNNMASSRMSASQSAMSQFFGIVENAMKSFTTAHGDTSSTSVLHNQMASALEDMTVIMNSSNNGEFIFAGVNTDVRALAQFEGSSWQADLDSAFVGHFGFAKSDAAASTLTSDQMADFIESIARPLFETSGWPDLSSASERGIKSRIAPDEVAITSITANENGIRDAFFVMTLSVAFNHSGVSGEADQEIARAAIQGLGGSLAEVTQLQGKLGLVQAQISEMNERMTLEQNYLMEMHNEMSSVDPYEAATRVTNYLNQLEMAYTLTQRIQSLSLVNYL